VTTLDRFLLTLGLMLVTTGFGLLSLGAVSL
jgi:hypothetical protein